MPCAAPAIAELVEFSPHAGACARPGRVRANPNPSRRGHEAEGTRTRARARTGTTSTLDAAGAGGAADVDGGLGLWALRGLALAELGAAERERVLVMS